MRKKLGDADFAMINNEKASADAALKLSVTHLATHCRKFEAALMLYTSCRFVSRKRLC